MSSKAWRTTQQLTTKRGANKWGVVIDCFPVIVFMILVVIRVLLFLTTTKVVPSCERVAHKLLRLNI